MGHLQTQLSNMSQTIPLNESLPWIHTTKPPLANAPMLNIATAQLAVSVSAAGGIGFLAGGYDVTGLETHLHEAAELIINLEQSNTAHKFYTETGILPLGVGFLNWGADREAAIRILRHNRVAAVWLFAPTEMPGELVDWVRDIHDLDLDTTNKADSTSTKNKTQIWVQIGTVHEAATALSTLHPDVLVVQGSDAGGHGLAQSASLITLLPEIHALLNSNSTTPLGNLPHLLAAGGITTGRTLLAALTLGATGAVMGTRFLASKEARISNGYRNEILRVSDGGVSTVRSTVYDRVRGITGWPGRYNGRGVINRSYVDAVEGGMGDEENRRLYLAEMERGDDGWGPGGRMTTYAGTGVGLVREVLGAREIVEEVWGEASVVAGELGLK